MVFRQRLLELALTHLCWNCVVLLVVKQTGCSANSTNTDQGSGTVKKNQMDDELVKGLAAGFGFFFGLLILVCLVWCLCCANVCNKDKGERDKRRNFRVSPSPPVSANVRPRVSALTSS